jgi:HK97 family phage major capsid protein
MDFDLRTRSGISDAREHRVALVRQMRELNDRAVEERRDLTSEERQTYERLDAEQDALGTRIREAERALDLEAQLDVRRLNRDERENSIREEELAAFDSAEGRYITGPEAERMIARRPTSSRAYRDAFETYLRARGMVGEMPAEQRAALQVGTDAEGGYTVPDEFLRELVIAEREFGIMRQLARIVTTGDDGDLLIPTVATRATAAWTAEEAAFTESEPTFGQVILRSYKVGAISKVSDELLHDSAFDILAFLARDLGEAVGILENTAFVTGASGSTTTPEGIVKKATVGKTFAANNAITADELIDVYHSLLSPYRANAVWMMRDSTVQAVRKLKTTENQYLWQPGLQAGQPDLLLGRPLLVDPDVPAIGTVAESVVFGDIGRGYWIRDVEGVSIKVLNELYAANGQVGFRLHRRTDGDLVDTQAVRIGKHPV